MKRSKILLTSVLVGVMTLSIPMSTCMATVSRNFAGNSRYDTAVKIASSGWTKSLNAVISAGANESLVDALTAAPLAKQLKAPLFFTDGQTVDSQTISKLRSLGVKTVYLTSGENVISKNVEDTLRKAGISDIRRVGGGNRFDTAVNIANIVGVNGKIMIARADEYADALSAAAIAAKEGIPILLAERDSLPTETMEFIKRNNINTTYILGLEGAVSRNVEGNLVGAKRLGGGNRYETNVAIIKEFEDSLNFNNVYIACGESGNLVDALAGAPLAANEAAPIVLTSSTLDPSAANYLSVMLSPNSSIKVLGGLRAVPNTVTDGVSEVQKNLSTSVAKARANIVKQNIPAFKQVTISAAEIPGAAMFRVEGSNAVLNFGQKLTMIIPGDKVEVYIYSSSNKIIGKGTLDVSKDAESKTFDVRIIK